MSKNLAQIYIANPITTPNTADLIYLSVNGTTDGAIKWQDLLNNIPVPPTIWIVGSGLDSAIAGDGSGQANGDFSLAFGSNNTQANGIGSFAFGFSAQAQSPRSFAFGNGAGTGTSANGYAFAFGNTVNAVADYSFAFGLSTVTVAPFSFAFGNLAAVNASTNGFSFAFGNGSTTSGDYNFAFGNGANANNNGSWVIGDSNAMSVTDSAVNQFVRSFAGGYYNYVGSTLATSIDTSSNFITRKGTADQSYSLQAPSTGFSITIGAGVKTLILNPSGTLLSGTVIMPAAPINGQEIRICTSQTITTLTISPNSGQTLADSFATGLSTGVGYIYNLANTKWFRLY